MNEVLVIDKPKNMTSRDVVNIVSNKFHTRKVGHTGTLDPLATGVLVILIGKYTSLVEIITSYDKIYEAEITLGIETDTMDITGNIIKEEKCNFSKEEIIEALNSMIGEYEQVVPAYSAIKINGKKLYEYARENKEVELPKRKVNIKSLELISEIKYKENKVIFNIRTNVSKGTYIRSLVTDIASKLGTIGTMSELRRIKQGNISIEDADTLEDLENDTYRFYDINKCLKDIYSVELDAQLLKKVTNGVQLENVYKKELVLFKYNGSNIAIYKADNNTLKMWKYLK